MVKKTIILLVLYFLAVLLVCGEKNILPNLTKEPEPVFFGPLEPDRSRSQLPSPAYYYQLFTKTFISQWVFSKQKGENNNNKFMAKIILILFLKSRN